MTRIVVGLLAVLLANTAAADKPHIVFFLADDMGFADVGFHGSEIKTPNIDKLAAAGARLEQFYVQPVCSPTRAALMTGRYPIRHGLQVGVVRPWAQYGLPLDERTLPQALKEVGYETAIVGKWHLGHFQPEYLPTHRGFDHQYGHYNGQIDYFTHIRDDGFDWHKDDKVCRDEGYTTHLIANEACRIVAGHDPKTPLFLYVPFNAVHAPHQVLAKYKEPYLKLKEPRRTYAGMVAAMDEAIGQIVAAIDKRGMRQETLFIFCSDNGGPQPGVVTDNGKLRAGKTTVYEGGVRVCACAVWDGHIKPGSVVNEPLHMVDWYPTILKLAGAKLEQKHPLDGRDAWPTLTDGKPSPHGEILLNATPAGGAIRVGNWKFVLNGGPQDGDNPVPKKKAGPEKIELFDMSNDMSEANNLAAEQPDKVKELRARYEAYLKEALPPKGGPKPADFKSPKVWGEKD
ncbi:MAG TPA: arylsulfatase [Gemmataceae bacterium]|jgi:arylsulfatase A-like enzyme|nr:arylsulfatase [Gemmataceae bacterium]